jgi:hypothetical protein
MAKCGEGNNERTAEIVGGAINSSMNWWIVSFTFVQNPLPATSLWRESRGTSCVSDKVNFFEQVGIYSKLAQSIDAVDCPELTI